MAPRKRAKLDANAVAFGDVLADLDLEISLRERIAGIVESRIAWALILQESLNKGGSTATTSFRNLIFETLSAIEEHEEPLENLFSQQLPPTSHLSNILQAPKAIRLPPRQKKLTPKNPNIKFLYIKTVGLDPPYNTNHIQTYLLRCPTCSRQTFTSLQGLLNHARISHNLEWGTHDECVRACAVMNPDLDLEAGIEVGLGPSGILPGLRSLFQMAVGAHRSQKLEGASRDTLLSPESDAGSHLTRTLGLHRDTPALAPFLGKKVVRREINVWDADDNPVDIITTRSRPDTRPTLPSKRPWRMPFKHRSSCSADNMDIESIGLTVMNTEPYIRNEDISVMRFDSEGIKQASGTGLPTPGSRFHFTVRVVMTDRSLWIPPNRRQEINGHTHKWMLSVESPSYSRDIATILQHLRVTSLPDPLAKVLIKSESPFTVVGTTDRPFLARVELVFSGISYPNRRTDHQTIVLEHWVELDLLKSTNGAVGEEQVIDIELDKQTILMPTRLTNITIEPKSIWNPSFSQPTSVSQDQSTNGIATRDDYSKILSGLVRKFPMTQKDVKNGRLPNPVLPYKLVSTPAQLKSLVHGRRKAIEWGRARALRNAYTHKVNSPNYVDAPVVHLTTGDVFAWLTEEGHFLKPLGDTPKRNNSLQVLELGRPAVTWCPVCGQGVGAHLLVPTVKKEALDSDAVKVGDMIRQPEKTEPNSLGETRDHTTLISCNIVPAELHIAELPVSNMGASTNRNLLQHGSVLDSVTGSGFAQHYPPAIVVTAIPPMLTLAVRKLILSLNLPAFKSGYLELSPNIQPSQYTRGILGTPRSLVEQHLAPHAMVALATKQFIQILVGGALEVSKGEKAMTVSLVAPTTRRTRKVEQEPNKNIGLLTPGHILSSILARAQRLSGGYQKLDVAIAGCLSKLGKPAELVISPGDGGDITLQGVDQAQKNNERAAVKIEQP